MGQLETSLIWKQKSPTVPKQQKSEPGWGTVINCDLSCDTPGLASGSLVGQDCCAIGIWSIKAGSKLHGGAVEGGSTAGAAHAAWQHVMHLWMRLLFTQA